MRVRRVTGVDVMEISASDYNIGFRGLNQESADKTLLLIDGRSVFLDFYGIILWDALPVALEDIDRIEIIKGPGSSIYGGNAFNGVINIITKSASDALGAMVNFFAGKHNFSGQTLIYRQKAKDLSCKVSVNGDQFSEWENAGSLRRSFGAYMAIEKEMAANSALAFSASVDQSRGETFTALDNFIRDASQSHIMLDYEKERFQLKMFWNHLDATVTGEKILNSRDIENRYDIQTDTYEIEARDILTLGASNSLLVGGNIRINTLDSDMIGGYHKQELYGLFVENEYTPFNNLSLIAGGRYDHHPLVDGTFSPRLGLVYTPLDKHHVRLSYSSAYGLPIFVQSYLDLPPLANGNEDLNVDKIRSFNAGYTGALSRNFTMTLDLFYNQLDDFIIWDFDVDKQKATYINDESFDTAGVEIGFDLNLTETINLYVNYAFLDLLNDRTNGKYETFASTKINAGFGYASEKLRADVSAHYVDSSSWGAYETGLMAAYYDYSKKVDAYYIVNANICFSVFKNMYLSLHGDNVLNHIHRQYPMGDRIGRRLVGKIATTIQ